MAVPTNDLTSSSSVLITVVMGLFRLRPGKIPAQLANAGSGDTCGVVSLPGGAIKLMVTMRRRILHTQITPQDLDQLDFIFLLK